MKLAGIISAIAFVAAAASSCINEDYDLAKLNPEMTVIPELTVPVNKEIEGLGAQTLMSLKGTSVKADKDGNYTLTNVKGATVKMTLSGSSLSEGIAVSDTIGIAFKNVPSFLQSEDCGFKLCRPQMRFVASNSSSNEIVMTARATAYGEAIQTKSENSRTVELTAVIPAGASSATVLAECEGLEALFSPVPEYIKVDDIVFHSAEEINTKSVKVSLQGGAEIPLCFEAGSSVIVDYTVDVKKLGIDLSSYGVNTEKFSADCKVKSTFPMDFDVEVLVSGPQAEVELDRIIEGGSIEAPSTTDVKANFSCDGNINDIKTVTLHVKATNRSMEDITLTQDMSLSVAVSEIFLTEGITLSLNSLNK